MARPNLLAGIPTTLAEELVDILVETGGVRIERIVSRGHISPPGFWYEQPEHEWVLVVRGRARLGFDDGTPDVDLAEGDHLLVTAGRRHRVVWTDPEAETIWVAVFFAA
jgi:cupin 2 domain-containing protein